MMKNMFSMFDPSSSFNSVSWMILMIPILLMMVMMKNKKNLITQAMALTNKFMEKEMNQLSTNKKMKFSSYMMTKLFVVILLMNTFALVPFNFTPTAHMSITLTMSLSLWLSIMLWGWLKSFNKMLIHLTPMGTPNQLMNFMVLIEMVSNMIRPITLSVRLSANMVAGHLLMSLLSNFSMMSNTNKIGSLVFMVILTTLEMMVAMIQAYVLTTLLMLYYNESV